MGEKVACQACEKSFPTLNDLYQHIKVKHGRKAAREVRKLMPRPEPSLGEELVEASIAWRCEGVQPPEYLRAMFPDHFPRLSTTSEKEG